LNKKYAIVSIVLIALMSFALIPASKAWVLPNGKDDQKFAEYGPQATTLFIDIYPDYSTEFTNFKSGTAFDVMDWPLMPTDLATLRSIDPNNLTYMESYFSEFGLFEYDLNDQVMPTNLPAFRVALSYLANKYFFINYFSGLAGSATPADSPIASCTGYYNPSCPPYGTPRTSDGATLGGSGPNDYADMLDAYEYLCLALGTPVPDPGPIPGGVYGNYWWTWTSPYPTPSVNYGFPALANGHLLVFARASSPARALQGTYLEELLERALPNWINTNKAYLQTLSPPYTLPPGCNGVHIYVDDYITSRTICFSQAMSSMGPHQYRYNVYTGGWSLTRDPDFLQYYTSRYSSTVVSMMAHNYGGFMDPKFDTMITGIPGQPNTGLLVTTAADGDPYFNTLNSYHNTIGNATYWAYSAQIEMMQPSECALIPMWYATGDEACLAADDGVVNTVGFGLNGGATMLNAFNRLAGTPGYWEPAGQYSEGFQSDWSTGNPITAPWVWDWDVLSEIYDTLLSVNPYFISQDRPYIADNWTYGTWNAGAAPNNELSSGICTTITFSLREDVFWQDVPYTVRNPITWNDSSQINGPFQGVPFTPVDVAFSIMYLRDLDLYDTTENGILVDGVVDHVIMNPCWESLWNTCLNPSTGIPVWFNTTAIDNIYGAQFPDGSPLTWTRTDNTAAAGGNVQFSSSVDPESIEVCFTGAMGWLGLHRVGSDFPIIPFHIWSQIAQDSWDYMGTTLPGAGWFDPEPSAYNVLYGTGPYILTSHVPTVSFTFIANVRGASYGSLPGGETVGYFWDSPARTQDVSPVPSSNIGGTANGTDTEAIYWKQGTNTLWYTPGQIVNKDNGTIDVTVQCWLDYLGWNPTLGAWVRVPGQTGPNATSTSTGIVIGVNETVQIWEHSAKLTFPSWCSYIDVWEAYLITVTSQTTQPCQLIGRQSFGGDFYAGPTPGYQPFVFTPLQMMFSDNGFSYYASKGIQTEMININHLAGDISGGETWAIPGEPGSPGSKMPAEPYGGSDHKIGLSDLMLVAFNWNKKVPWAGNDFNAEDAVHRADITQAGTVGLAALMQVAFHWNQAWTDNPPRDPTIAEMQLLGQFPTAWA
jgi:hypothetical protein